MTDLQPRGARARARRFEEFPHKSYADGGGTVSEWRLRALEVRTDAALEGWYGPADVAVPVIGRVRIKRRPPGSGAEIGDLAAVLGGSASECGVTEVLNLELEPLFFGQRLGVRLLRYALSDVPGDDLVILEPTPTSFVNIPADDSLGAVMAFYRRLGLVEDHRLPGYLVARRRDLVLS